MDQQPDKQNPAKTQNNSTFKLKDFNKRVDTE